MPPARWRWRKSRGLIPIDSAEPAREVGRIGPAHRRSDRRHGVVRSRQHDRCAFRTNLREIVHRRHPQRPGEAASEVGGANVGQPTQLRERPGERDVILDQRARSRDRGREWHRCVGVAGGTGRCRDHVECKQQVPDLPRASARLRRTAVDRLERGEKRLASPPRRAGRSRSRTPRLLPGRGSGSNRTRS